MHCDGGGSKENGNNPNTVLGWVGLSETVLGRHSLSILISALSSNSIHLITCLLPPPPWPTLSLTLCLWRNPRLPIQPTKINAGLTWLMKFCPSRRRQSKSTFFTAYIDKPSSRRTEQKDPDEEMYKLVGKRLVCLAHPFGSPLTALNVGLKHDYGRKGPDIDM